MPNQTKIKTVWVYRTKRGKFYRMHNKGSWAVSTNGVNAKDITTDAISGAAKFDNPGDTVPYCHSCMHGGKWLEVKITTTYEVLNEE